MLLLGVLPLRTSFPPSLRDVHIYWLELITERLHYGNEEADGWNESNEKPKLKGKQMKK